MTFQSPNYTQVPNDLFDEKMRDMGEAELKVVLAIVRQTIGYHRTKAKFSVAKLQRMTGLSWGGVISGATKAEANGYIKRTNPGAITSAEWELIVEEVETPSLDEGCPDDTPSLAEGVEEQTPSLAEVQVGLNKVNLKEKNIYKPNPESVAQGIINSGKGHGKENANWPADVKEWGITWNRLIERQVTKTEFALCIKEFRELMGRQIDLPTFENGYHAAVFFDGMSITHPLACAYAADEIRKGLRDATGMRKNGKRKPGEPQPLKPRPISAPAD